MINVTLYNDDYADHIYIQRITQKKKGFKIPSFNCGPCIKDSVTQEDRLMKKLQY